MKKLLLLCLACAGFNASAQLLTTNISSGVTVLIPHSVTVQNVVLTNDGEEPAHVEVYNWATNDFTMSRTTGTAGVYFVNHVLPVRRFTVDSGATYTLPAGWHWKGVTVKTDSDLTVEVQ